MSELSHDVKGELKKLAEEREKKRQENNLTQVLNEQTPPAIPASGDTKNSSTTAQPAVEPTSQEAVLSTDGNPPVVPKEEKKEEPPLTAPVSEEPLKAWDDTEVTPDATVESKYDFKKLGSALGFETVKDEAELVQTVTKELAEIKQLRAEKDAVFQGVPESLKEAMEVAKKGGDWQTLLNTSVDVSSLDSIEIFEREYERKNIHKYKLPDGKIDYEKLDAALDAIPDELKEFQGDAIKQQIAQVQMQKKQMILVQAEKQHLEFRSKLSEAAKDISKVLPKESFGITFEPKHSEFLYSGIANQSLIKKHLGDVPPEVLAKFDPSKLVKAIALSEYGDKIAKFQYSQGQVAGKKELLSKTQNVVIPSGSLPAPPEQTETEKPKTSTQKLKEYRDRHFKQGSL